MLRLSGSSEFISPDSTENPLSNTINTGMFDPSPLFIKSHLVVGESGGVPGFESASAAVSEPPPITTASSWWGKIKNDMGSAFGEFAAIEKNIYGGIKDITKTVYTDLSSGAGAVYDDVSGPVASAVTSAYWYAIIAVVVIGGVIYFAGKSGALKLSASV